MSTDNPRCNDPDHEDLLIGRTIARWVTGTVVVLLLLVGGCMAGKPQYNLYKANTQKRERIAEAKAESDAAQYTAEKKVEIARADAEADRVRAEGIADANRTIANSLTPEYIRWYFIDRLDDVEGQIIYVPTEGNVPITDAGRAVTTPGG